MFVALSTARAEADLESAPLGPAVAIDLNALHHRLHPSDGWHGVAVQQGHTTGIYNAGPGELRKIAGEMAQTVTAVEDEKQNAA